MAAGMVRQDPRIHVAVITPYRAQVLRIQQNLRGTGLSRRDRDRVHVGTVHTFQGSERAVVIWDLVETRNHRIGRLYRGAAGNRLANVAITRAQGKLILLGDFRAFSDAPAANAVLQLKGIIARSFRGENRVRWESAEQEISGRGPGRPSRNCPRPPMGR